MHSFIHSIRISWVPATRPLRTHRDATFSAPPTAIRRWPVRTAQARELPRLHRWAHWGYLPPVSTQNVEERPSLHLQLQGEGPAPHSPEPRKLCLALTWCSVTTYGTAPAMALGTPAWSLLQRAYQEKRLQGGSLLRTSGVKRPDHQHM